MNRWIIGVALCFTLTALFTVDSSIGTSLTYSSASYNWKSLFFNIDAGLQFNLSLHGFILKLLVSVSIIASYARSGFCFGLRTLAA
jgi:hypothetical protein